MPSWHLTVASDGRTPLFPDEARRRAAVRTLARVAGQELVLFSVVDDHVHLVVTCDRSRVGWLGRAVVLGLRTVAAARGRALPPPSRPKRVARDGRNVTAEPPDLRSPRPSPTLVRNRSSASGLQSVTGNPTDRPCASPSASSSC